MTHNDPPPAPLRVDIVIPTYNEAAVLRASVQTTLAFCHANLTTYDWRIVIADNGPSTDGTQAIARELESESQGRVHANLYDVKGRGRALREAWTHTDAAIVSYMDVDLSTDIRHLPRLIDMVAVDGCDVAIGSRLARGSRTSRGLKREITSRGYVLLIRTFFPRIGISDAQCGFKAVNRRVVEQCVSRIENRMWFFDTEMLILARRRGFRVCELPVHWLEDPDTKVKIISTAIEDVSGLIRMRFGSGRKA